MAAEEDWDEFGFEINAKLSCSSSLFNSSPVLAAAFDMTACENDDKGLGCEAMACEADADEACEAGFGTEDIAVTTGFCRAAAAAGAGRNRDNTNASSSEEQDCSSAKLRFPSTRCVSDDGAAVGRE